jgi:RNA polymerase sigma factor (TIGR02999 family)
MSEVTQILNAIEAGEPHAAEQLLPLVYDELRKLAAARLAQEKPGQTLQPTALVHEAYLRLVDVENARQWDSRGHFFAAAAEAIRRILVESARRKQAYKRGGRLIRLDFDEDLGVSQAVSEDLLSIHEALEKLASVDEQAALLVKCRYFAGLTIAETADVVGVSPRTADRLWAFARAWLYEEINGDERRKG